MCSLVPSEFAVGCADLPTIDTLEQPLSDAAAALDPVRPPAVTKQLFARGKLFAARTTPVNAKVLSFDFPAAAKVFVLV